MANVELDGDDINDCVVKAEQGHAYSQYLLGYSYYLGRDVPQSYKKAVFWYKKEHSIW